MHHNKEEIVCPNCGTQAFGNYCYECGQQTHLHKDTLWGMILHFFEHYFHYDNKFWKTIKTLLFKPGELTLAYWRQQRMRYISPVSLYIFISAVYFGLVFLLIPQEAKQALDVEKKASNYVAPYQVRSQKNIHAGAKLKKVPSPAAMTEMIEKVEHVYPKAFFFLVPFMAFVLYLLFIRSSQLYFVDHLIFSIHCHSFYFLVNILLTILSLLPSLSLSMALGFASYVIQFIYFKEALRKVYNISGMRAGLYTVLIGLLYMIFAGVITALFIKYFMPGLIK